MDTNQDNTFENMPSNNTTNTTPDTVVPANDSYHFWAEENVQTQAEAALPAEESVQMQPEAALPTEESMQTQAETTVPAEEHVPAQAETTALAEPPKKQKKEHRGLKKLLGCIGLAACFGIVAGGTFFGVKYAFSYFFPEEAELVEEVTGDNDVLFQKPDITISSTQISEVGEMDATETVAAVVEQTMPAMVSIQTLTVTTSYFWNQPIYNEQEGGGSGIIVGSNEDDLLIATNYHVIEGTTSVKAILADGTTHDVTVKGSDADADLAILALPHSGLTQETLDSIDIAVLGDSDSSKIGQMVIAIGNALGYGPSVTVGYLSAKDREITIEGNDMVLLQTNAAINSGNSGGALLNTKGEVIGINNAKLSSTDIEGICFAIPISMATPILDDLMTREILSEDEKGYLGVAVLELESAIFQDYNWPEGVYVSSVTEDSAAQKAGIYQGDIITHVNGTKVTTANQLINAVTSNRYGTVVEITLQRVINGVYTEFTYSVTLQQNPELLAASGNPEQVPEEDVETVPDDTLQEPSRRPAFPR